MSVMLLSVTALSYEILLTRLFAIIQWHHFAYMIISLALLGYGVSGTFLTLYSQRLREHFTFAYITNIVLFSITLLLCFIIVQQIPFNAEEILWDWRQLIWLSLMYLLLMLPFFFAANAIGLTMIARGRRIPWIYAADLTGAGVGSVAIVFLLYGTMPVTVLQILYLLGISAVLIAVLELNYLQNRRVWLLALLLLLPFVIPSHWLTLSMSPYKGLQELLRIDDTRIIDTRSSPLGLVQVVESPKVPIRYAPGLSLQATTEPPSQLAVFTDGDGMTVINKATGVTSANDFLDQQTSSAVYHLREADDVLVLGAGSGNDVLQARLHDVKNIDAVELNPQIIKLMTDKFSEYSGHLYQQPGVHIHVAEARGFVAQSHRHYDVIQMAMLDNFAASAAGLYSLSESYLYTVEAFQQYIRHLSDDGFLTVTRWVKLPPRDNLKIFATALAALTALAVQHPERHLILIRSWQTATLLVKKTEITSGDVERIIAFCERRGFDTAYYPGMEPGRANRYNQLRQADFYNGAIALTGDQAQQFYQQYKFNIAPATDDKPYFFNFFKWDLLQELMDLKNKGGMPLIEWGYVVLITTLVQALVASLLLIMVPLVMSRTTHIRLNPGSLLTLWYFLALGAAFMFIEIAFIQKFILFLHNPLYAIAISLTAFLVFAGAGSYLSGYLQRKFHYKTVLIVAVVGIIVFSLLYYFVLGHLFEGLLGRSMFSKALFTIVIIAPLAMGMGMPFPLMLSYLNDKSPALVPWAWGVNGCASVVSAVLAMVLAIQFGYSVVILLALLTYATAFVAFTKLLALHSSG